jgi:hypothetical protein
MLVEKLTKHRVVGTSSKNEHEDDILIYCYFTLSTITIMANSGD